MSIKMCLSHLFWILLSFYCSGTTLLAQSKAKKEAIDYVNPFIGTDAHGHVFLGANVPFGGVQLGPVNIVKGWDWCSGYHYSSKEILGFTHTHLSGTGIGDWGDILLLPATGDVKVTAATKDDLSDGYGSHFSHQDEQCSPGYYKVLLKNYNVLAELTATERTGTHKYTFRGNSNPHILLDLAFGVGWDKVVETSITVKDKQIVTGKRFSSGWARDQRLFFAMEFSKEIEKFELYNGKDKVPGSTHEGLKNKGVFYFKGLKSGEIVVKVGISNVSESQALLNLKTEAGKHSFDQIKEQAINKWRKNLSNVLIEAPEDKMVDFYTAMYHTKFFPSIYSDVDGQYRTCDGKINAFDAYPMTTVYSLWDTYRAFHPLMTIIEPQYVKVMINSILSIYKEQGLLPVWHLSGNETNTMVGYHAVPVIVDAYLKGMKEMNVPLAYQAVKASAMQRTNGIGHVSDLTFIPADSVNESVAKALEYAIDDDCISMFAKALGEEEDADYFAQRAQLYRKYFDASTGHMRGVLSDGSWRSPFDPFEAKHRENDYCEGNAWQYTWLVPHDVKGLISLFGSDDKFTQKLDQHFKVAGSMGAEASPDISGLIGQYAHGNEPNHHVPYLYAFAGQPWRTAEIVHHVVDTFYNNTPAGLCGNEDAGQMSAWYVFSSLGFYPVHPANGVYVIGSPIVDKATITQPDGSAFNIIVKRKNPSDIYVQRLILNGKSTNKSYIMHADIVKGGELIFEMGPTPSPTYGVDPRDRP